jgi:hypothetical protein
MYHPNVVDETKLSCSKAISAVFECSRQNFMWQRMLSRARLKDWAALKDLAIDRGIFLTTTGERLLLSAINDRGAFCVPFLFHSTLQRAALDSALLSKPALKTQLLRTLHVMQITARDAGFSLPLLDYDA